MSSQFLSTFSASSAAFSNFVEVVSYLPVITVYWWKGEKGRYCTNRKIKTQNKLVQTLLKGSELAHGAGRGKARLVWVSLIRLVGGGVRVRCPQAATLRGGACGGCQLGLSCACAFRWGEGGGEVRWCAVASWAEAAGVRVGPGVSWPYVLINYRIHHVRLQQGSTRTCVHKYHVWYISFYAQPGSVYNPGTGYNHAYSRFQAVEF